MAPVRLEAVGKSFGATRVLQDIDLTIDTGEFVVFVGPSGSGKSTLLRIIAGLEETTAGGVYIDGADVTHEEPAARGIAMVFQSYALYPHMDVFHNMAFNLELSRMPRRKIGERVREAAAILRLEDLLERMPSQLSGGQRQRVAIGRAIVRHPKVFLFDEPLSNLDAALRVQMRLEIERLHRELGTTMIYVTHDQVEAMTLADRIVALEHGRIQQTGAPLELYHRPANRFVAQFIGSPRMNVLERGDLARAEIAVDAGAAAIGLRPEHLHLVDGNRPGTPGPALTAETRSVERLGNVSYGYFDLGEGSPLVAQLDGDAAVRSGDRVTLTFDPQHLHLFAADGRSIGVADRG